MYLHEAKRLLDPFTVQIGDDYCAHLDNVRGLMRPSVYHRMMADPRTRFPRPGFVEPASVVVWLIATGAECQ